MNDVTKDLLEALKSYVSFGCPVCGGDCYSANPPQTFCLMKQACDAIARAEAALSAPQRDGRKDSDRLDAIQSMVRASSTGVSFDWCRHVEDGCITEKGYRMMWRRALGPREPDIRQAIDAAMGWKRPQGDKK